MVKSLIEITAGFDKKIKKRNRNAIDATNRNFRTAGEVFRQNMRKAKFPKKS